MKSADRRSEFIVDLTPRETQVIRLLSLGCSVREVAAVLGISPSTADNHKARSMRKLGIRKSQLLTRVAIQLGISNINDQLTISEQLLLKKPPHSD
jgi:DNA-binding CsgD family transcriptional regulator